MGAGPTHLRVVLDQLGLLHDLDIPLTAIGLLGDRDADQFGRLVLRVGHDVGLSPRLGSVSVAKVWARGQLAVCASNLGMFWF